MTKFKLGFTVLTVCLALAITAFAAEPPSSPPANPPSGASVMPPPGSADMMDAVLQLMVKKGLLTSTEVNDLKATSPAGQMNALLGLLKAKGVVSESDLASMGGTAAATPTTIATASATSTEPVTMAMATPQATTPTAKPPEAPKVAAAVAPIRVLPIDPPKREGVVPDIKIGPIRLKPYGFFKTSAIYDSSQPRGIDFPLPQFIFGDTGPDPSPEFHVKARSFRVGTNFEWMDIDPSVVLTGRFEVDFEGNFTRVDNRNISSIRSSQPSIRLAWTRLDYLADPKNTFYALFGQDWTPYGSTTLPNLLESTGLGIGFGTLYERQPQIRFGWVHDFGGAAKVKFSPEFAVVLPAFGNVPSSSNNTIVQNITTVGGTTTVVTTPNTGLGLDNQLSFGERQGADSARPELHGRAVFQFQLDPAPNVAPAQIVVSGMQARREAIVRSTDVPAAFRTAFPRGVRVGSDKYGISAEVQLPTRWFTVLGKWYRGGDLRWFFAGQLFSFFNDTTGLTGTATAPSIDGSAAIIFGLQNGVPTVAPQRPVRAQGGFVNLGLPLSRWFNADPAGHNAGWQLYFHYGLDQVVARDVRRFTATTGQRVKSDLLAGTILYKLNQWVTFGFEQSMYRTFALPSSTGVFPLWQGFPTRVAINRRSEFATVFTF